MGMLEARIGQPEVVEPVLEGLAGDGDREVAHVGEVGQDEPPGLVHLAEDDLLLGAVQRSPAPDPPLQGAADPGANLGMAPQRLLEDGDRPQARGGPQQGDDLAVPDAGERLLGEEAAPVDRDDPAGIVQLVEARVNLPTRAPLQSEGYSVAVAMLSW